MTASWEVYQRWVWLGERHLDDATSAEYITLCGRAYYAGEHMVFDPQEVGCETCRSKMIRLMLQLGLPRMRGW